MVRAGRGQREELSKMLGNVGREREVWRVL
jgi:hypothetical protein